MTQESCQFCLISMLEVWNAERKDHKQSVEAVVLCPLHRAAPLMLEALESVTLYFSCAEGTNTLEESVAANAHKATLIDKINRTIDAAKRTE